MFKIAKLSDYKVRLKSLRLCNPDTCRKVTTKYETIHILHQLGGELQKKEKQVVTKLQQFGGEFDKTRNNNEVGNYPKRQTSLIL